jgi:hypothetical protein
MGFGMGPVVVGMWECSRYWNVVVGMGAGMGVGTGGNGFGFRYESERRKVLGVIPLLYHGMHPKAMYTLGNYGFVFPFLSRRVVCT